MGRRCSIRGYQLNPGDMFSVEPDMVLYATGAKKVSKKSPQSSRDLEEISAGEKAARKREKAEQEEEASEAGMATLESEDEIQPHDKDDPKEALKALSKRAQKILEDSKRDLSGKRLQELRSFRITVKKTMSKFRSLEAEKADDTIEGLETGLAEILTKIPQDSQQRTETLDTAEAARERDEATSRTEASNPQMQDPSKIDAVRTRKDAELLHAALERARENPIDHSKPYATPWKPRDYMSAFAFIPRYLEVNQNVCSAVYLRHPVARPGLAEVPTPFHGETMGLAFNWYLRRR